MSAAVRPGLPPRAIETSLFWSDPATSKGGSLRRSDVSIARGGSLGRTALLALALLLLSCASASPVPAKGADAATEAPPPAERQVMVTYPPGPPPLWARISAELSEVYHMRILYAWTMASLGEQCVVFEAPPGRSARDIISRLASDRRVSSVQAVESFSTLGAQERADPYTHLQHSYQTLRLDQAHRLATGKGVRVAVVDTGVDFDHPDLRDRVTVANNFVDRGERTFTTDIHGTAVAGVIAASVNDVGIVGVAPGAEIYALKACWQQPPTAREAVCNSYTLAKAMDFAIAKGSQIINFSLGGPPDALLGRLIGVALSKGIVVVAANGGPSRDFPASVQGVIGIIGSDDLKGGPAAPAAASSQGPALAAPAVDVLTTVPKGSYDFFSGSSLAAAEVSGIAALLLQKDPKLTPARVAEVIRKTARPLNPTHVIQADACAAVASVAGGGGCG
jgi:subtilisin family serine protease